ncbi:asparagine synthase (glutamine-hydrolyzing) [Hanstruepera marina]|uniref:asparagine synthase (glutamine-hydrolyzing) n=1 Tax=Hanstruepera marina TaxID=2873265 RepID=UPI001CA66C6F|nr:asparagine synthase (glutamine-hydrolyzing) [Hanstruepera marina]
MCGINGIISQKKDRQDIVTSLTQMNDLIVHRGPDDDGMVTHSQTKCTVGMAMRRLSIIDLNSGKQPIYNDDKSIAIVFNGEIYNYKELRNQLMEEGVQFNTQSDTEVILKLYIKHGTGAFRLLDGMYAFSILDTNIGKVFIARDFFGEKPLYYYVKNDELYWASELKSIIQSLKLKPELSKAGLNLFFKLTYIPAPYTIYNDIYKLEANHFISYDLNSHNYKTSEIFTLQSEPSDITFDAAVSKLNNLVINSIESRSVSDVPIGTFLSGGVDSSIVSLGLSKLSTQKIDTFSIGFDKKSFDETDKSKLVANLIGSNHHEFIISEKDIESHITDIILNFDEPFADSSALPTYLVSKKTSDFVKVALTGDGGDEVFGGYNKYYIGKLNTNYTKWIPEFAHKTFKPLINSILATRDDNRGKRFKAKKFINAIDYNDNNYWNIISLGFGSELSQLINSKFHVNNPFQYFKSNLPKAKSLHDFREVDRHISLEGDMLVKVDRTSMLNSLECRTPFLNKTLWEFSNSLPESYLLKGWSKKHILKEAFKHEFPEGFLDKSKKGFVVPVGDWLRSILKIELQSYTETAFLETQGIFNINYIQKIVNEHITGKIDNSYKVWTFFTFQKWYKNIYLNTY